MNESGRFERFFALRWAVCLGILARFLTQTDS